MKTAFPIFGSSFTRFMLDALDLVDDVIRRWNRRKGTFLKKCEFPPESDNGENWTPRNREKRRRRRFGEEERRENRREKRGFFLKVQRDFHHIFKIFLCLSSPAFGRGKIPWAYRPFSMTESQQKILHLRSNEKHCKLEKNKFTYSVILYLIECNCEKIYVFSH